MRRWTSSSPSTGRFPRSYLDRWSLVHLLSELRHPEAAAALNRIVTSRIPRGEGEGIARLLDRGRGGDDPHDRGRGLRPPERRRGRGGQEDPSPARREPHVLHPAS